MDLPVFIRLDGDRMKVHYMISKSEILLHDLT